VLLTSLTLHNFGAYRGRNVIDLTPPAPEKPIVLFGGLNGAGKTTILDALQLVLYGRRARCSGRGSLGYPEFLKRCINRTVPERDGAGLELQFTATHSEQSRQFHVHRSWGASGSGRIRERLTVMGDGLDTTFLSERWDEIVEEMLPLDISSLFFFDGEKIEALADPQRAGKVIGTAIETLLGVNLLDRLGSDLIALEKRRLLKKSEHERMKSTVPSWRPKQREWNSSGMAATSSRRGSGWRTSSVSSTEVALRRSRRWWNSQADLFPLLSWRIS
jgi:DNA sulfur modification protein DndD